MIDIDNAIAALDVNRDREQIDQWIGDYTPFIIATLSQLKNEYVHIENDECYSIALMAFVEAIERYDIDKGPFLPYSKLVITSRVNTYLKQENKHQHISIESLDITPPQLIAEDEIEIDTSLLEEITQLEKALADFDITFSALVDSAPKHSDTKITVIDIAKKIQADPQLMQHLYDKKRLPLSKIGLRFFISIKTLKSYKSFIIAVIMILEKDLYGIKKWIQLNENGP